MVEKFFMVLLEVAKIDNLPVVIAGLCVSYIRNLGLLIPKMHKFYS